VAVSPSLRRTLLFGGAVLALLALVLGAAAASEPSHKLTRVALFGDSLSFDAERYTANLVANTGRYDAKLASLPGTAICDWFPQMRQLRDEFHPQIVAFQFVGNAILPCMRGPNGSTLSDAAYLQRWQAYTEEAIAFFGPKVTIDLIGNPEMQSGDNRVYDMWQTLATHYPNTHFFDGGALVSPNRTFVTTLPCLAGEPCTGPIENGMQTNVVRAWDGIHFCPIKTPVFGQRCPVYASGAYRFGVSEFEAITGLPAPAVAELPAQLPPVVHITSVSTTTSTTTSTTSAPAATSTTTPTSRP
jgi:hypothetical protein